MKVKRYIQNIFTPKSVLESERTKLIGKMRSLYNFLEKDFGYEYSLIKETDEYPGGPKFYINKYKNLRAKRQVEITLRRNSTPLYFYIKRLQNDIEPQYSDNENCFSFYEVDIYNGIENHDRHNPYLPPDYEYANVKTGYEILKSIPKILNGTDWFDRNKLDRVFQETRGYKSGHGHSRVFSMIKKNFSFLETNHNFKIIYDYDNLRPFEQDLGGELIYSDDKIAIGFAVDLRDQLFSLYLIDAKYYSEDLWMSENKIYEGATTEINFADAKRKLEARIN